MDVRRSVTIGLLAVTAASAQAILDNPKKIADAQRLLDTMRSQPVRCDVFPLKPRLAFSLRMQSGYFWRLHLSRSKVAGQKWIVLAKVTPKEGSQSPKYFSDVVQFPTDGDIAWEAEVGHFAVGEGRYDMSFLMFDDRGQTCRKDLQIDAHLNASERLVEPLLPPNTIASTSWTDAPRVIRTSSRNLNRLTILLDAADQTRTADQSTLMDALTALIDELPARSRRLVLFDLAQQKEVFRRDEFTSEALPEVAKAMAAVQFEPMQVGALQNPAAAVDLIENLANLEIHSPQPADAVVFLGLPSAYQGKPSVFFGEPRGAKPQFFYVVCPASRVPRYYMSSGMMDEIPGPLGMGRVIPSTVVIAGPAARIPTPSSIPNALGRGSDCIEYLVDRLGGRTLRVDSPEAFAKGVVEITRMLAAKQ
jgi:hypothetical protein